MQFLTLWTSLNHGLLRFSYSISIQYRLTACTWARKSTNDYWLTSSRRLLYAFLARGLKMASKEIEDVNDSDEKGENYQRALILLNVAVDILRSFNYPWPRRHNWILMRYSNWMTRRHNWKTNGHDWMPSRDSRMTNGHNWMTSRHNRMTNGHNWMTNGRNWMTSSHNWICTVNIVFDMKTAS